MENKIFKWKPTTKLIPSSEAMQLLTVHAVPKQRQADRERDRANPESPNLGVSEPLW